MKAAKYIDNISIQQKLLSKIWIFFSFFFFKPFTSRLLNFWRIWMLKMFGAKIGKGSMVYSSVNILAPWNLTMHNYSVLGPYVALHLDKINIGSKVTVSQGTYLCNGSHDISYINKPFISAPIIIKDFSWIAADAFIGPGVTIGEGAVVGARAAVFKDVEPWTVVGGNPAKFIKKRIIKDKLS
ncbi:hypothetical protein [Saccharicrinis sp. FJH54]|uniref:hypothetical protein n=1 Tax=Saccharicrinis sp. FJH54 TaxID=3344665 RepID=UPI0035D52573